MQVVDIKKYNYSNKKTDKWKNEAFLPLSDLKLRLKLDDGVVIECAAFHLIMDGRVENHACVSTQAGCKFGCKFCTSGKNGYVRDLSQKEIENELIMLRQECGIDKFDCVVFMGVGEPLDNYEVVIPLLKKLINNQDLYNGARIISLATIGIPSAIDRLAQEHLPVELWLSLHAPCNEKRKIIMPVAHKYTIEEVLTSAAAYSRDVGAPVWLNYMLFLGFNNTDEDADNLARLLKNKENVFKLIITEPNKDIVNWRRANYNDLLIFEDKLKSCGVKNEIVRFMTAGKDISAGCGEFLFLPN